MKYTVKLNQKIYEVEIERAGAAPAQSTSATQVGSSAQPTYRSGAASPQLAAPSQPQASSQPQPQASAAGTDNTPIECPMPGKILSITAAVGQRVNAGDCLMVLEAMKMENEMVAPRDGTVKQILVSQGTMVNTGDVLAVLI